MKRILLFLPALVLVAWSASTGASERELIDDNQFRRGFILWDPKPGKHVQYGELKGCEPGGAAAWGLSQWSSRFPLDPATAIRTTDSLACSNSAKGISVAGRSGFAMTVNSEVEYGAHARSAGDPWVHLLVEQEFDPPAPLSKATAAKFHLDAQLLHSRNLHRGDYSPAAHAAQFQVFFTVQNRNRASKGYGDLLWFGVPVYDNRDRFPREFKARDFGGTAKFIFTPGGQTFTAQSAQDGKPIAIDKDLLPLMREALEAAWARGYLKDSRTLDDYYIGGMNMGWELPGTFDVQMTIKRLSLKVTGGQS